METYDAILERMVETYEEESGARVEDVSEIGLRLRVLAGELFRLETSLDWLERQAFPQTATGKQLDLHGDLQGVFRKPAEQAKGTVTFSRYLPLTFDLVVPQGTVCATSGEPVIQYETTQDGILEAGELTVDVPVKALEAGAAGNTAAGYVTTLVSAPTGIHYVSNQGAITGGREEEEDEAYRQRILDSLGHSPSGANGDYYRKIALEQEGITAVQVVPRSSGAGTVTLYVWGEGAAPSASVLQELREKLESAREIGVNVTVQAATEVPMTVHIQIEPEPSVDFAWAKEQVAQAITAYGETRQIGDPFYLTDVTKAALNAAPLAKVAYPSSMMDVDPMVGYRITVGTVQVEEIV